MRRFIGLLLGLGIGVLFVPAAFCQDVDKGKPAKKAAEKTFSFAIEAKPWKDTLTWLVDATGLSLSHKGLPTGTFTFLPAAEKKLTVGEIVDILNEALLEQKFILIRRGDKLTLAPADEPLDPALVPSVSIEELRRRGRTEVVSVTIPLKTSVADELAPEVKKLTGPFGRVVVLTAANKLVIQDTAANLRRIVELLQEPAGNDDTLSYRCRAIDAVEAATVLTKVLGVDTTDKQRTLAVDPRTNTIIARGPADFIAQARTLLTKIDAPAAGKDKERPAEPRVLKILPVVGQNGERLARLLQEIHKDDAGVRIVALGPHGIAIWADLKTVLEIEPRLREAAVIEIIPLMNLEGERTTSTLRAMLGDVKTGGPFLEYDASQHRLIARGSAEQIAEVKRALGKLMETDKTGPVRVLNVERGSAATLAKALETLLTQMRPNGVKVVTPLDLPEGKPAKGAEKKGVKPASLITITAAGDRLILVSDDREALALAVELTRLLQAPAGEGDFEVVRLRAAQATKLARILDEAFNGRDGKAERVRIVADPEVNALLLRARPLDLLTIRRLIEALDVPSDNGFGWPAGALTTVCYTNDKAWRCQALSSLA